MSEKRQYLAVFMGYRQENNARVDGNLEVEIVGALNMEKVKELEELIKEDHNLHHAVLVNLLPLGN